MNREVVDADGKRWYVVPPCIFCGQTYVGHVGPNGVSFPDTPYQCPGNGNAGHIRPDEYPDDIIERIKKSRGLA